MTWVIPDRLVAARFRYQLRLFKKQIADIKEEDRADICRQIDDLLIAIDEMRDEDPA